MHNTTSTTRCTVAGLWILPLCLLMGCQPQTQTFLLEDSAPLTFLMEPPITVASLTSASVPDRTVEDIPLDLWERTRRGFKLSYNEMHPEIQWHIRQYRNQPLHLQTLAQRAKPYFYLIIDAIEKRGLPMELAYLPMVESALDPFVDSLGNAAGIWQIVPGTADTLGLHRDWWYDGRRDIIASTDAALNYLSYLNTRFHNDWLLALAAYNSGEGTVSRAIRKNHAESKLIHFYHLDLPKETQAYVPKLLALVSIIRNPERYGLSLPVIENRPQLASIDIGQQVDLMLAAKLAEISIVDLYRLNPGYHQWATHPDPDGPHQLLLPIENAAVFEEKIAAINTEDFVNWQPYTAPKEESLQSIAKKNHTTVEALRLINKIAHDTVAMNQELFVPIPTKADSRNVALFKKCTPPSCQGHSMLLTHLVKAGETLQGIAKKYQVSVEDLQQWNGMKSNHSLKERQSLVIRSSDLFNKF